MPSQLIHATTVSIDTKGVLIRGKPGSGKSYFALSLIRRARQSGLDAGLVADDQTIVETRNGDHLVARCPDAIAGKIEVRPYGIMSCDGFALAQSKIECVCDLVGDDVSIERVQAGNVTQLMGLQLRHLCLPARQAEPNCAAVFAALGLPCWY